jgi:hypothetical protein
MQRLELSFVFGRADGHLGIDLHTAYGAFDNHKHQSFFDVEKQILYKIFIPCRRRTVGLCLLNKSNGLYRVVYRGHSFGERRGIALNVTSGG